MKPAMLERYVRPSGTKKARSLRVIAGYCWPGEAEPRVRAARITDRPDAELRDRVSGLLLENSNATLVYVARAYDPERRWYPPVPASAAAVHRWLSVAASP